MTPIERELTLADIWLVIWKRKLVIMLVAATTFLLGALFTFLKKPVYESLAQIQIDPSQRGSLGLDDIISQKLSSNDFDSRLLTQVKILQSDTVSMQVIKDLDLAHKKAFAGNKLAARISVSDPVKMNPDDRDALLTIFNESESVEVLPKTQMIGIRFRSTDPELATENRECRPKRIHAAQLRIALPGNHAGIRVALETDAGHQGRCV